MGWNGGYTVLEATVIGAYNLGKLDKALLGVLLEPYRDTDIDSGGSRNLRSTDGKGFEEIVIRTWGLQMPPAPPGDYDSNPDEWDEYRDEVYGLLFGITRQFGW
jgi:hypothetical protein